MNWTERAKDTNFNPRSPHGERPRNLGGVNVYQRISIHAPRTGSDSAIFPNTSTLGISIHAPRTGSDIGSASAWAQTARFQSTLPARGATSRAVVISTSDRLFQSTLPARGATRVENQTPPPEEISIHAPRTGSDGDTKRITKRRNDFNPRSPHGERPVMEAMLLAVEHDFNPRSPHGERRRFVDPNKTGSEFQSTLPARGATGCGFGCSCFASISIHAPRTGSDVLTAADGGSKWHFNPRSPHGERLSLPSMACWMMYFNPRSPHGERHREIRNCPGTGSISIHAPRTGSDRRCSRML